MKELVGKRCSAILSRRDVLGGGYPWFFDVLEVDMPMIKVDCWHDVRWIHADVIVTIGTRRRPSQGLSCFVSCAGQIEA